MREGEAAIERGISDLNEGGYPCMQAGKAILPALYARLGLLGRVSMPPSPLCSVHWSVKMESGDGTGAGNWRVRVS